jgi:NADH dehydrogenase
VSRLIIAGGGFAGVWAALGAAALRAEHAREDELDISLITREPYLTIRPRLYETPLPDAVRVPLDAVLDPIGVRLRLGEVSGIDVPQRRMALADHNSASWDALVVGLGSRLRRPDWHAGNPLVFSVDTYEEARRLDDHLSRAASQPRLSVTVVGSGLAGLEVVTSLAARLGQLVASAGHDPATVRLHLVEAGDTVAPGFSGDALTAIAQALELAGVDVVTGAAVSSVQRGRVVLADGRELPTHAVVWTGGLEAHPLAATLSTQVKPDGRVPVGLDMRPVHPVANADTVFVGGDAASVLLPDGHHAVMSCQHAMPLGRQAGYNAAARLLGAPMEQLALPEYATCLDLGPAGGIFTTGWERTLRLTGSVGKQMKSLITERLIYPPVRDRAAALAAGRGEPPAAAAELGALMAAV